MWEKKNRYVGMSLENFVKERMEKNPKKWISNLQGELKQAVYDFKVEEQKKKPSEKRKDVRQNVMVTYAEKWFSGFVKNERKDVFTEIVYERSRKYLRKSISKIIDFVLDERTDIKEFRNTEMRHKSYSAVKSKIYRVKKILGGG